MQRERWIRAVRTVAAYRDRYGIEGRTPLGTRHATDTQRRDAARANAAIRRAEAIARETAETGAGREAVGTEAPSIR